MASVPAALVEIGAYFGDGYRPVLDFHGWRVAMLRYVADLDASQFQRVERHLQTNEVFILTAGAADLIVCEGDRAPGAAHVFPMRPNVACNIQQAVWHQIVMTSDAHVILFERTDTTVANSEYAELPAAVIAACKAQFTVS